ncbi:MAG: VWA domain-containing protein [Planctomycetia bacterium]|nr:VWA domain-containing protein [Planctomycetia bacterium]
MARDSSKTDALSSLSITAALPAWLLSVAIHLLVAITGSLLIGGAITKTRDESPRTAEIVLARRTADHTEYFADEGTSQRHSTMKPIGIEAAAGVESGGGAMTADQPPLVAGIALPDLAGNLPIGDATIATPQLGGRRGQPRLPVNPLDEAAILAEDALIPREKLPTGPTAQLSLFGSASAEGRSFVFVIDHSNSMGGEGLGAIQAAAKELAAHINQLTDQQTFQVVAYNQAVAYLTDRELIPATAENKRKLVTFVANLAAYGQTEHTRGLLAALRLKPEVIFLLTDGGDPPLDPGQLRLIREEAAPRTAIHCLHFGRGPQSDTKNFLARLAAENRGSYVYIDMNGR